MEETLEQILKEIQELKTDLTGDEIRQIHFKNDEQDNTLARIEDRQDLFADQLTQIHELLKRAAFQRIEKRLDDIEKQVKDMSGKINNQQLLLAFFQGFPRPLQFLFIFAFSLAVPFLVISFFMP